MCSAVAIPVSLIPKVLFDQFDLLPRVRDRGGNQPEVWFTHADREPLIPVRDGGGLRLYPWGSRDRKGPLPVGGWTWRDSVEKGAWNNVGCETEPVVIPATYGCEKGVWFRITEGIRGLLVRPPGGAPVVYMMVEEPTRYFKVMTRGEKAPSLIDEVI